MIFLEVEKIRHLGDICKLNGAEIPVVDCITGGSPCQDLSVAGKRAGLAGKRSGLFIEQMRLVKEMREHDRSTGRPDGLVRPRYMVWENVPGALSSPGGDHKGEDFQAVLEEIIKVAEPDAPGVPLPEEGRWSKAGCIYDELGKWSLAWRVTDSQFFGVPQRRKRIGLLVDFNGLSAPWIMFEPQYERTSEADGGYEAESDPGAEPQSEVQPLCESLPGYSEPRRKAGKEVAGGVGAGAADAGGSGHAISFQERAGKPGGGKGLLIQDEHIGALSTLTIQHVYSIQGNAIDRDPKMNGNGVSEDISHTLNSTDRHGVCLNPWDVQSKHIQPADGVAETLYSGECRYGGGESYVMADKPETICLEGNGSRESHYGDGYRESDVMYTLNTIEQHGVLPVAVDVYNQTIDGDVTATVTAEVGVPNHSGPKVMTLETYHCECADDTAMTLKARDYKDPQSVLCVGGGGCV